MASLSRYSYKLNLFSVSTVRTLGYHLLEASMVAIDRFISFHTNLYWFTKDSPALNDIP